MIHGPDHAAPTRITAHLDEGAVTMARYPTHRFPATTPRSAETARIATAFPVSRKKAGRAALRGGQNWHAPARRPLRIPGR